MPRRPVRALLCPASLKGVLSARLAAAALARGVRSAGGDAVELPIADGGEGTAEALFAALGGTWHEAVVSDPLGRAHAARWLVLPDGRAVVEAAAAIGLPLLAREERDPLVASSRGLGELIAAALREEPPALLVGLGGSATVDGGSGLREVVSELAVPTTALCDVRTTLADAARLFGRQKGATTETLPVLERRLAGMEELAPYAVSRARVLPAGSARLSRPWARGSSRARRRFSTSSDSTRGSRTVTSPSPARARSTEPPPRARRPAWSPLAALRQGCAVSSSVGESSSPSTERRRSACQATVRAQRPTSKSSADVSPASALRRARAGRPSTRASSRRRPVATRRTA